VSRGYLTTVLVPDKAAPATKPEILSRSDDSLAELVDDDDDDEDVEEEDEAGPSPSTSAARTTNGDDSRATTTVVPKKAPRVIDGPTRPDNDSTVGTVPSACVGGRIVLVLVRVREWNVHADPPSNRWNTVVTVTRRMTRTDLSRQRPSRDSRRRTIDVLMEE
jgi:hypothetical protein